MGNCLKCSLYNNIENNFNIKNTNYDEFVAFLKDNNWKIELNNDNYKSTELEKRYKNISIEWIDFIKQYSKIENEEQTIWFLCFRDFDNTNTPFQYKEFELISLESADENSKEDIIKYWNENK